MIECEEAKKLTKVQKKEIYNYIYRNSLPEDSEEDRLEWTQGWFEGCLESNNAVKDMLESMADERASKYVNSPTFIQDLITYCDD